jgi:hypothetical protein
MLKATFLMRLVSLVFVHLAHDVLAHGTLTQPIPRYVKGKKWCPWCVGEHLGMANPWHQNVLSARTSSPCFSNVGDPEFTKPEFGGLRPQRGKASYAPGETMNATIFLAADHHGLASWQYCPHSMAQTEECFRAHMMKSENHGRGASEWVNIHSYWMAGNRRNSDVYPQKVYLPRRMPAGGTTIRWLWNTKLTDEIFLSCFDTVIESPHAEWKTCDCGAGNCGGRQNFDGGVPTQAQCEANCAAYNFAVIETDGNCGCYQSNPCKGSGGSLLWTNPQANWQSCNCGSGGCSGRLNYGAGFHTQAACASHCADYAYAVIETDDDCGCYNTKPCSRPGYSKFWTNPDADPTKNKASATHGVVTAPFKSVNDYVELPEGSCNGACGDEGQLAFDIQCNSATTVGFQAEIIAPNGGADSFYIRVDAQGKQTWHTGQKRSWGWSSTSPNFDVAQGSHTVSLLEREDGIKLKSLKITVGAQSCDFTGDIKTKCCHMVESYGLNPHTSWGTTPQHEQNVWNDNGCNSKVGGVDAPYCQTAVPTAVPTAEPTAVPTAVPAPAPTPRPTQQPSPPPTPPSCQDAAGTNTPWGWTCEDLLGFCTREDVRQVCPETCATCGGPSCQDAAGTGTPWGLSCKDLRVYCASADVQEVCPETCESCGGSSCQDAAGTNTPWGLTCKQLSAHCDLKDVQQLCPYTCGSCGA